MKKAAGTFRYPTFEDNLHLYDENGKHVFYLSASSRPISGSSGHKGAYGIYGGLCRAVNFGDSIGVKLDIIHFVHFLNIQV